MTDSAMTSRRAGNLPGDLTRNAIPILEDARARHQSLGDPTGVWLALLYLAAATAVLGDPERAIALSEQCVTLCDTRGAHPSRTYALSGLGLADTDETATAGSP